MTSKLNYEAANRRGKGQFPAFPPRDDMQNPLHLYVPGYLTTLSRHFGSPDTTLVLSEVPVGFRASQRRGILIPDLIVAFDVNVNQVVEQWGFSIEEQGGPPDFVLEVASPHTHRNDTGPKRDGYQA
ncbi:MAG: Uma2 family endonuclease [Chloroflexota bacterium]|nr:Uma2 family endonuclease [Chloroflexota bacterium]